MITIEKFIANEAHDHHQARGRIQRLQLQQAVALTRSLGRLSLVATESACDLDLVWGTIGRGAPETIKFPPPPPAEEEERRRLLGRAPETPEFVASLFSLFIRRSIAAFIERGRCCRSAKSRPKSREKREAIMSSRFSARTLHRVAAGQRHTEAVKSARLIKGAKDIYYPGAPHGITATHQDQVNADLLAFIKA
jgi:hypothetical protein